MQDVIVAHQPAEPSAHRNHAAVLRAERERLPVLLPVVVHPTLIALENGRVTSIGSSSPRSVVHSMKRRTQARR